MGGIVGGIVSSVVGSVVSNFAGRVLGSLASQFGMSNVVGALSNLFLNTLGGALKNVINNSPLPTFLKAAANQVIDDVLMGNQQPTSPEAQNAVDDSMGDMMDNISRAIAEEAAEDADKKTGGNGGANWLVALAGGLAEAQIKFLDKAMDAMKEMKENAGADNDDKDARDAFITAQSEYQASIQMFNMMANISATSLKSLGEGLTSIARKQ